MSIFSTENEMQTWLENKFKDIWELSDIICNPDYLENFQPKNISEDKIRESFETSYECLHLLELVTANQNISNAKGDILKPDLITYSPERETLVIIELKNFPGATREAGTEISAYSAELKSSLQSLSDGDIVSVIISPHWPTLIRHHIYNTIVYQNKNLLCLQPCLKDEEIKLEIVEISHFVEGVLPEKFNDQQLAGYTLCLYDDTQQQKNPPPTRLHEHIPLMQSSMDVIAAKGEKIGGHGFAFLSREVYGFGLSPYFISVINVAPFKCLEQILHLDDIKQYSDLPLNMKKYFDIYLKHSPEGYGSSMGSICKAAFPLLKAVCNPHIEELIKWDTIKIHFEEEWEPIYFISWGIFNDIAVSMLTDEYKNGNTKICLNSVPLGMRVLDQLIDKDHKYIELLHIDDSFFPVGYRDEEDCS